MVTSFSGEGAEEQARELVLELRREYKLPAYMHRKKFDLSKDVHGRGVDKFGNPLKMKNRTGDSVDEIAVMVGHFDAIDSPEAQAVLQKVKTSSPDCLDIKKRKQTNQSLAQWRILPARVQTRHQKQEEAQRPAGTRLRDDETPSSRRSISFPRGSTRS